MKMEIRTNNVIKYKMFNLKTYMFEYLQINQFVLYCSYRTHNVFLEKDSTVSNPTENNCSNRIILATSVAEIILIF